MAMPNPFVASFLYQYLVGSVIFGFGIYCGLRNGVLSLRDGPGRRALFVLCGGFLLFILGHGALAFWGK